MKFKLKKISAFALANEGAELLANAGELVFARRDGANWEFALPNDSAIDDDGWALIAPFGRHPKTRLYRDVLADGTQQIKEQKFIQVLDNEAADAMVSKENNFFSRIKRAVVGIPVYKLHGDMKDVDPQAVANTKEKIKIGVVDGIRKGTRGIEAHFALDNDGAQAVAAGYKYPSAYWYVMPNGMEGDQIIAKPFKMISVALTPFPNISGVESLANARTEPASTGATNANSHSQQQQNQNKNESMKAIKGYLLAKGTGNPVCQALANHADPNEDQIIAAVDSILSGRDTNITALANDKTTLNGTLTTLTADRDGHKQRADNNATALGNEQTARKADRKAGATAVVDAAIKLGILTVADRDAKITALENSTDFIKDSETLMKTEPTHKTNRNDLGISGRQQAALSNEQAALQNEYDSAFKAELIATSQDAVKAHSNIMHLPKYAGLAAKLVPRQN